MSILVNQEKVNRAKEIIGLLKRVPKTEEEIERKEKFAALLAENKLSPTGDEALEFVYVKLGGLIRTPTEQKEAEQKKAEIKKRKNVTR